MAKLGMNRPDFMVFGNPNSLPPGLNELHASIGRSTGFWRDSKLVPVHSPKKLGPKSPMNPVPGVVRTYSVLDAGAAQGATFCF